MLSETVVRRARASIVRSYRNQPGVIRASLPFDVADHRDVESWTRFKASSGNRRRYEGSDAWVLHSLAWDAKDALRRACGRLPRDDAGLVVPPGDFTELQSVTDKSVSDHRWREAGEAVASVGAITGLRLVMATAPPYRPRKALSVLSCLGRLYGVIHLAPTQAAAAHFLETLPGEVAFRRLPASDLQRQAFVDALGEFPNTGNIREDLKQVGLHPPGMAQWEVFRDSFGTVWQEQAAGRHSLPLGYGRKERVA